MIALEYEIDHLKNIYFEMVELVRDQMALTREALLTNDCDVANDVMRREGRVNSYELTIDRECEDFIALQSPVASDLRMALAILKMSGNLERIGDHAFRICSYVFEEKMVISKNLIKLLNITDMFDEIDKMLENVVEALEKSNSKLAKTVFKQDKTLDQINKKVPYLLQEYLKNSKDKVSNLILISGTIGKLERTGDLITNIAEEIIFYHESKVVKHRKRSKKLKKLFNLPGHGKE